MKSSLTENGASAYSWVFVNDDSITENSADDPLDVVIPPEECSSDSFPTITNEQTLKEFFVQFYFQCVLSSDMVELEEKFELLLLAACDSKTHMSVDYTEYIIKLCLQNRDIKCGKGLTHTTYMMLNTIAYYCYEKELLPRNSLLRILKGFVANKLNKETTAYENPYGSWKDIKYFLDYFWRSRRYDYVNASKFRIEDEVIQNLYIPQMISDRKNMSIKRSISLCGKWLPRESGRFRRLAKKIAIQYHNEVYQLSEKNVKIYQRYRKLISEYNKYLDTTQTHMAGKTWDEIVFDRVTSKTLFLNKKSFLNCKDVDEEHRHICKRNFQQFVANKEKGGNYLRNNNTVMPHNLVRNVLLNFNDQSSGNESVSILNMQWNGLMQSLEQSDFMKGNYCFPCIDVSPSMMADNATPLHCAIGLGLACAHLCKHNRAFTFSSEPEWIQYDPTECFAERVYKTQNSGWGSTTNIYKLFKRILDTCLTKTPDHLEVSQSEIDNTCLIIFSDMQFDCLETRCGEDLFEVIRREYKDAGYDNIPFLIFWNLRTTNTFPTIEKNKNMIQLSGNSTSLLEIFMKTSLSDFKHLDSWDILKQILGDRRYILS